MLYIWKGFQWRRSRALGLGFRVHKEEWGGGKLGGGFGSTTIVRTGTL